MPLPDERPRQSVANLIGRFEQQNKRQSLPGSPRPPISDAAKEDSKEKREWPPKSVASTDAKSVFTPATPSSGPSKSSVPSPKPTVDVTAATSAAPSSPESAKSGPPGGKASTAGTSTPTPSAKRAPLSPLKSRPSTVSHLPVKSLVKPHPPKSSLSATPSQPLKPQHTGQSVASNTSVSRTPRPTSKSVTSTPSRPKTPASQSLGTSRPKTPSSGLFAPTAASLARSRIAQPPLPPPVKKATLSNSATERLSKPTAASLSKARAPVSAVLSPSRVVKSTSTGGSLCGPSKLKAAFAPDKLKEAKAKEVVKTAAAQSRDTDPAASEPALNNHSEGAVLSDVDIVEDVHSHADLSTEGVHDVQQVLPPDPEVSEEPHAIPEPPQELPELPASAQEDPSAESSHVQDPVEEVQGEVHEEEQLVANGTQSHEEDVFTNGDGHFTAGPMPSTSGNDIEDIVNLLEATSLSKSRPQSMITIPDEHLDTSEEA